MSDSVLLREERDAKKLQLIRDGRAKRVAKMHAGNFGKGVDSTFIEKMKADKRAAAEVERAADRAYGADVRRMNRVLTQLELDEHRRKEAELADIKATWEDQRESRARREADLTAEQNSLDLTAPEDTALGAAQNFVGADIARAERKALQQRQMARWVHQGKTERAAARKAEADRDADYHKFMTEVNSLRDELEEGERTMRKRGDLETKDSNSALVQERKAAMAAASAAEAATQKAEVDHMLTDRFLCENPRTGPDGKVSRADFKGLTLEERRAILDSNANERNHNQRLVAAEKLADKQYAAQARSLNRYMAQAELEEHQRRKAEMEEHKAVLKAQCEAARAREAKNRADARGEISAGFFARFGTSC